MTNSGSDTHVPGGVYLCQINTDISCGACCGLYNVTDLSRPSLHAILKTRTQLFTHAPRTIEGILGFKEKIETHENQLRPYPEFHHCPYIGMIGEEHSRVGCLLHPLAAGNNGIDFRGLSYYGGMACRNYFCPTYHQLSADQKRILRHLSSDWYEYGLIITEGALLKAIFKEVERRQNQPVTSEKILQTPQLSSSLQRLFRLKLNWPFHSPRHSTLANYFFEDHQYQKPSVSYPHPAQTYQQPIFYQLCSSFADSQALRQAERQLEALFLPFDSS
jgi:hypothetical protein